MKNLPAVSCICPAYGRIHLLEEAIHSFLQQDYPAPKELIVLNDHPQYLLEFSHPEVKIYNHPTSFHASGEKWNAAVALAAHDLIFMWDVADIYLSHRLSLSVEKFDQTVGFYKLDGAFLWGDGRLSGIQSTTFHHSSCWSRQRFEQAHGYDPQLVFGSEEEFEHRLRQNSQGLNGRKNLDPKHIYTINRWQHKPHHRPLPLNRNKKAQEINQKRIQLNPHWKFNYPQLVQDYLATVATPNRFQNPDTRAQNIRVDFMIAGAQKSGTSALDAYLRLNPEICMAGRKEVHFFDNERIFNEKSGDFSSPARFFPWFGLEGCHLPEPERFAGNKYDLYHAFFAPQPPHRLCGEATPECMYWYDAPRRMWLYNSSMKIIILLRNPIERAYSHWNMRRKRPPNKRERRSFRKALEKELQKPPHTRPLQFKERYIDRGFYTEQIRRIWHYFPKEQTLFLKAEALKNDPQTTVNTVCDFLGVEKIANLPPKKVFVTPYANPLSRADHALLKAVYQAEIKKLEQLLGWDCQDWLRDPAPSLVDK